MKSPTLSDVAREAGVSYATADRVLNCRSRVSERAACQVRDAVERLGYVRNVAAANLSQQRQYRFAFVLPDGGNAFFETIGRILSDRRAQLALESATVEVHQVPAFNVSQLLRKLEDLSKHKVDGVAVVGLDATALSAPLETLRGDGVPIVSLVSDLPHTHRDAYIGIDNLVAGRTAARLMGMAHAERPGLVQVIVGDLAARDHVERHQGFMDVLSRDFPMIETLCLIQGRDHPETIRLAIEEAMAGHPEISGIYSVGAGNTGLFHALKNHEKTAVIVVHELVEHSRAALESGVFDFVIDQCPEDEVDSVLALMRALVDRVPPPSLKPILPTIYVRDNLPPLPERIKGRLK